MKELGKKFLGDQHQMSGCVLFQFAVPQTGFQHGVTLRIWELKATHLGYTDERRLWDLLPGSENELSDFILLFSFSTLSLWIRNSLITLYIKLITEQVGLPGVCVCVRSLISVVRDQEGCSSSCLSSDFIQFHQNLALSNEGSLSVNSLKES